MSNVLFYRCEKCGNMIAKIKDGGGPLSCCGQEMKALKANTEDAAQEKHVPDVERVDGKIKATVGSVIHPSIPEHYIEWIALVTDDKAWVTKLEPGMVPTAEFPEVESGSVYEYCNLHGLWKADF